MFYSGSISMMLVILEVFNYVFFLFPVEEYSKNIFGLLYQKFDTVRELALHIVKNCLYSCSSDLTNQ